MPELESPQGTRPEVGNDGPGAETRFLAGLWDVVVAAAGGAVGAPAGVLVVDDLQWADDATVALLSFGLRRLDDRPVLVVLTWRTPFEHPVRRAAVDAARDGGAECRLDRLSPDEVAEMVSLSRPGDPEPDLARQLWERTEGVPLLLVDTCGPTHRARPALRCPRGSAMCCGPA